MELIKGRLHQESINKILNFVNFYKLTKRFIFLNTEKLFKLQLSTADDGELSYDGALSGSADDDTSVVTCDSGYVVSYCEVKTGGLGSTSDGAWVSTSGDACTAVNAGGGDGVIAHATCSQKNDSADGVPFYNYQQDSGTSASLDCPTGYSPHLCTVHSPWKGNLDSTNFNNVGVASDPSQCEIDDCYNWCRLSLICTRDDGAGQFFWVIKILLSALIINARLKLSELYKEFQIE